MCLSLSLCLSVCLTLLSCVSVCLSVCLAVSLSVCMSVGLSFFLSFFLSTFLSFYPCYFMGLVRNGGNPKQLAINRELQFADGINKKSFSESPERNSLLSRNSPLSFLCLIRF